MTEAVGWISSLILLLTIGKQVYKQWESGTSKGVSKWLFVGQTAASLGFVLYSYLLENWVFLVTNSIMVFNGILGLMIFAHHRRRDASEKGDVTLFRQKTCKKGNVPFL